MSGPTSHLPSSLHTQWDYTKTLRSSSRLSWDGQFPSPPSPSTSPPPPAHNHEQHRDRGRDRGRELSRPKSFSNFSQLSANQDRWSYDRIRLSPSGSFDSDGIETPPQASSPQRQPPAHRPVTPEEVQEVLGLARGRAGRSLSPPRSRPVSAYDPGRSAQRLSISSELLSSYPTSPLASPSTPMSFSPGGSIPTLRITQPPSDDFFPSLSSSPPSSVGNRTPQGSSLAPTRAPKQQQQQQQQLQEPGEQAEPSSRRQKQKQKQKQRQKIIEEDVDEPDDACCFGACRRSKVRAVGGRVTGWLLGTLLPVAFGVVMGVVAKATGGR